MSRRLLRGAGAAIVLLIVSIGVPAALVTWGRWPIHGVPTGEQLRDLPTTLVSDTAVFAILTVAAWCLWALFMVSVVIEAKAELTGRDPIAWLAPPAIRRPASVLVAAVLMTVSAVGHSQRANAAPLPAPQERSALPAQIEAPPSQVASAPTVPTQPAAEALREIEVRRGDNPWDLATTHLGDPMRWRELWDLNRGIPQPGGMAWTVPDLIEPGWRLRLPADAQVEAVGPLSTCFVVPGDTLSEIARDHLGSVDRYPEIFEENVGRIQPDGETLTNPDLIEPGWRLDLPAEPAAAVPASEPPVVVEPPRATPTVPDPAAPTSTTSSTERPPTSPPPAMPSAAGAPGTVDHQDERRSLRFGLIGGGTATAGLLLLLERRRRIALRQRAPGTQPAPLDARLDATERELRAGARWDRARHVDAALRAIAASDPEALSTVRLAIVDDHNVRFTLDDERLAPPGFRSIDERTWASEVSAEALDQAGKDMAPPLPTMCPIGVDQDGAEILIDLEAAPVTLIDASDRLLGELLRSMAPALTTSPWATHPRVLVVGLSGAEGAGIQSRTTLAAALEVATAHAGERAPGDVRARLAHPEGREAVIVLSAVAPERADKVVLEALARQRHSGVAIVCPATEGVGSARRIDVGEDGSVSIGDQPTDIRARRLSEEAVAQVAELIDAAGEPFVPSVVEAEGLVDLRDRKVETSGAVVRAEDLGNELDVIVNVLGEVEVERLSPAGRERLSVTKQRALEAVAYIALRESSVDREDVQAALWPEGTNSAKTFANAIWEARRVLGTDTQGRDLLPDATEGRYTMSEGVGTDYGLFCELVATADGLDRAADAAELLAEALRLVRGEPFTGVGRSYAWVGPHRGVIVAQVLDAAEELAEVRLATGDWRGAEWAARQGLRAMPCDERMYRLLMRAAHAAGNTSGVHRVFKELCDAVADPDEGVEPDETVHPDTIKLMEDLTASGRSTRVTA
jgi:DNA-binding SARP family transcriptional activator/nucleoid-associated protein YgaU